MSDDEKLPEEVQQQAAESAPDPARPVRRGGLVIGLIILVSLVWYLLADRYTPYTDQARVQGYVVGVAPKVGGLVTQVWVDNNQRVEAGQRLFEIDPSQYRIALEKARSDLENARNQVAAGDAAVDAARASLRAATANRLKAEKDVTRLTRLRQQDPGTISVRRLEVAQATLEQARAQVQAAEADIQRAIESKGGDVDEINAILNTARTAVEKAELDLDNTTVTAETDGMVTDLRAEVGIFAGAGKPVLTMIAFEDVWISAEFTENNLGHLSAGDPVEILFDAMPGEVFDGTIRSIGVGVSAGQAPPAGTLPTIQNSRDWLRQSQRFPVVVEFTLTERPELRRQLRIGGQASVIAYSEGHGLLSVLGRLYIRLMSWLSYAY
ncbi:transporter [Marinobacterium nitratireducens]|uniref:Transporter n=1 Tax=Marinobacterium nitratireducens TaxID=518897 RepID=A0A918DNC7_9GAMM|nr:HlyD family secretion protein [Marinobacterium nitratireducens]GGO76715.1 transporter [Marinobacterium nitratireducens]